VNDFAAQRAAGARGAALFGKIPARPDFVRERFAGPSAQRLDQWLVRSVETMLAARGTFPPIMLRYAFSSPDTASFVLGVLSPSRDQVGRDFPVTVFCSVPAASVVPSLVGVPLAFGPFFAAAEALIREVPALEAPEVLARLEQLPAVDEGALPAAAQRALEALRASDAREHLQRVLGDADGSAPAYAYYTASAAVRATTPSNAVVLDCPIAIDVDLLAWLKLAHALNANRENPNREPLSFFWTEDHEPRLLISFGPPSTQVLSFVANRAHTSARLWPLTTSRSDVAEQVRGSIAGQLAPLEQPGTSIDYYIDSFVQQRSGR
jgi:type VI secretion system protein ImpM